jgi:hypothetical protein
LYIYATHSAVSEAIVVEKEINQKDKIVKQQILVYFVSEALMGSNKFNSKMEKIYYVVIMSSWKLRHYLRHKIKVLTNQPLNDIFGNRDNSERISKWAMELSQYAVDFEKCSAIKSQVLADFMVEWMEPHSTIEGEVPETPWVVYCDRAWGATGARAVVVLLSPSGIKLRYAARM